jgi:hypothetical protein
MSDDQTRQITEPIYYDEGDAIRACDSAIVDRGIRLVWTRCAIDVPETSGSRLRAGRRQSPARSALWSWRRVPQGAPHS